MPARSVLLRYAGTAVILVVATAPARAAFVNGVERFEGGLDLNTWERLRPNGLSTSSNGLNIRVLDSSNEITTRTLTVGVGQGVQADIRVNSYHRPDNGLTGEVGLFLSTNTSGPSDTATSDSEYIGINSVDHFDQIIAWTSDGVPRTGLMLLDRFQPAGATHRYRITRLSHDSARYEVLQGGQVLGSMVRTFNEVPDDLFISVWANGVDMTVHNVTFIPEPAAASVTIAAAFPLLLRRRRLAHQGTRAFTP